MNNARRKQIAKILEQLETLRDMIEEVHEAEADA